MRSAGFVRLLAMACAPALLWPAGQLKATEYFIASKPGTGSGTWADPYGLADLPSSTNYTNLGKAINALQPGDTLTFLGGDYSLNTVNNSGLYYLGYLRPARSGTAGAPITIRGEPGQTVRLINSSGGQPLLGTRSAADTPIDYIRFQGFTLVTGANAAMRLGGNYDEISYCDIQGSYVNTGDNHDGIRVEHATHSTISHNIIQGVTGDSQNSAGVKIYKSSNMLLASNYVHGNTVGLFDKDSGTDNTIRRNYITGNSTTQFLGNNQGTPMRDYIYDNVLDGQVDLHYLDNATETHDNLIRGNTLTSAWAGQAWNNKIWNNIVVSAAGPITAFRDPQSPLVTSGSYPHFAYLDYNVYTAAPQYQFGEYVGGGVNYTMAQMQSRGYEQHAQVASASSIFVDQTSYVLKTPWATAGRYGDAVGPDDIASILDLTGYGPGAYRVWGDANQDGIVDMADYVAWFASFGRTGAGWRQGDFTGDGLVDMSDHVVWFANYGSARDQLAVPEPATAALMGLAMLFLVAQKHLVGGITLGGPKG
ncbi:MAG: NosD domain-containing protein [Phycisphaerae bacterium]